MVPLSYRPSSGTLVLIARRLLEGLLTAWAAVSVTFFALRMIVGDPLTGLMRQGLATPEQVEDLRRALGLEASISIQYFRFLSGLLRGDLGTALYTSRSVSTIIAEQLPATIELAMTGFLLAITLGLSLGIISAWKERSRLGRVAATVSGLITAFPVAFTGVIVLLLFQHSLSWLPEVGMVTVQGVLLPALALGLAPAGAIARLVQAGLRDSMVEPYMLAARARGIRGQTRLLWHALKPALPPVISISALELAFLLSGTVVTEMVFSRPGLGRLLVHSILTGDYPIAQGIVVLAAVFYTFSHLIADLLSVTIDPRLRKIQ